MRLAARSHAVLLALHVARGDSEPAVRHASSAGAVVRPHRSVQNFLEKADAPSHYPVMGAGDAVRSVRNRPPTVDPTSRNPLDIRATSSICKVAVVQRCDHVATRALREKMFTFDTELTKRARVGLALIPHTHHPHFGKNIHAKYRKSATVAPILQYCAMKRCALFSDLKHEGKSGSLRDHGATPNERSGR